MTAVSRGVSGAEIARAAGIPRPSFYWYLTNCGLPRPDVRGEPQVRRGWRWSPERAAEAVVLIAQARRRGRS